MKNIILLIAIIISSSIFAQTKEDKLVLEVMDLYDSKKYNEVIQLIDNSQIKDFRLDYFVVKSEYELLDEIPNFSELNSVRTQAEQYLKKYSSKRERWTNEINDIVNKLNKINPAKTLEEYNTKLKVDLINNLNSHLEYRDYNKVLSSLHKIRSDKSLDLYEINYFEAVTDFELLKQKKNFEYDYSDVVQVRNSLNDYLQNYSNKNTNYTSKLNSSLTYLNQNYPTSQNDYTHKKEEFKRQEYEKELENKIQLIRNYYSNKSYNAVISHANSFPSNSKHTEEVTYYKNKALYDRLTESYSPSYFDITEVRNSVNSYLENNSFNTNSYVKDMKGIKTKLDSNYPKSYEEFQKKKEKADKITADKYAKEQRARQKEAKKISRKYNRNSSYNSFFALGYEGGEIAKYGVRLEFGGKSTVGMFFNIRTSLIFEDEINESFEFLENKNEAVIGLNFKLTRWLYLNTGAGYGFYYDKYLGEKVEYIPVYGGITLRLGRRFNLSGGASFQDIEKSYNTNVFKPEYTLGLTINLK